MALLFKGSRTPLLIWIGCILFLITATVVVGGATRLTNSGLSITEWKPIVGAVPPLSEADWHVAFELYKKTPEYHIEHSHLDLAGFKFIFFWEYLHRNMGRLLGLVCLIPFLIFWIQGRLSPTLTWRVLGGLCLGGLQGGLGWLMVMSGLSERVDVSHYRLAAHLLLAFVIFGYFLRIFLDLLWGVDDQFPRRSRRKFLSIVGALQIMLVVQIVYGAFVAGLRAGYAYPTFPKMLGHWLPDQAHQLSPYVKNFVENPTMVQFVHRWLGVVLVVGIAFAFWKARDTFANKRVYTIWLAVLSGVFGQFILGAATVLSGMSLSLALMHQIGALILFGLLLTLGWLSPSVVHGESRPDPTALADPLSRGK